MTFRIAKISAVLFAAFFLAALHVQPAHAFQMYTCGLGDASDVGDLRSDLNGPNEWSRGKSAAAPLKTPSGSFSPGDFFVNHNAPINNGNYYEATTTGHTGAYGATRMADLSKFTDSNRNTVVQGGIAAYPSCPTNNESWGASGYTARATLDSTDAWIARAVGKGSWGGWVLRTAADSVITGMSSATLKAWTSAGHCYELTCNQTSNFVKYDTCGLAFRDSPYYPGCPRSPNVSDLAWEARFYKGWAAPGYGFSGSGALPSIIVAQGQTNFASNLSTSYIQLHVACHAAGGCLASTNQNPTYTYTRANASLQENGSHMVTEIDDRVNPNISVSNSSGASSIISGASPWLSSLVSDSKVSFTVNGSDSTGSGVQSSKMSFDSGPSTQSVDQACNVYRSRAGNRCPSTSSSSSFGFKPSEFSNGSHSLTATVADADNNQQSKSYSFNIDNQNPGLGSCGSLSASPPASSKDSSNKGWVRSEVTVQGSGCDTVSGLSGSKIEYQQAAPSEISINSINWPSSASNLPSASCLGGSQAAAGAIGRISSCEVDTSAFADGTALRFRWSGTDLAGNVASSSWTDPVYTDNTAPAAADVGWQAWDGSAWQSIETGWTNATKTRLTWNSVSQGNGSPLDKYSYLYDSDVDGEAADGCVLQQPSSTWLAIPSPAASPALLEDRSEQCRQGKHQAWLWIKDIAGNGAGGSPMSSFKSAAASNPTLNYDSVPTPQSRDESWAASDTLAPVGFSVVPSSGGLAGSWTGINSFTGAWTNPTITSIVTQAPILKALYKVGGGSTSGPLASQDIQSYSGCLLSGASCSLESIKAPSEGSHPVKLWLMDAAGNASLEQSAAGTINWRDGTCVPIN